jgi:hypothetical protein
MDWLSVVQWIVGGGGFIAGLSSILTLRYSKKIKKVEAESGEFDFYKRQVDTLTARIDQLYKEIGVIEEKRDGYAKKLLESESKRYTLKSCIAAAHKCQYSTSCPVLHKERENIEEWRKTCEAKGISPNKDKEI